MAKLLDDVCRCHDHGCGQREECERYLQRKTGKSHSPSLFPYDIPLDAGCTNRIPTETETKKDVK